MRYYPDYEDGGVSQHAAHSVWHDVYYEQPEEGSRYTEKVYSTKDGEQKLVREKVWEYQIR